MRVLVSIEPRVYRSAIGTVMGELRPHLQVLIVEPEDLEAEVARLSPEVVICSLSEPTTAPARIAWVQYRPYDEPAARIRVGARRWELSEVSLEDLLWVVDEAERIAATGAS